MFQNTYEKFLKTVKEFDLISDDTKKVLISTSGGKDANIMTEMLYRYQQSFRPDLELILANAAIPRWKYVPDSYFDKVEESKRSILFEEKQHVDRHREYWKSRGINTIYVDYVQKNEDPKIRDSTGPCNTCFGIQKQALYHYLEVMDFGEETRLAVGLTKWDMLYLMVYHILKANGKTWNEIKEKDPGKYRVECMHYATFSPYPKINTGIPGKTIYTIEPIIALSDLETREFAKELDLPVIPDICVELYGNKFNSDKRHFDNYLKVSAREEVNMARNNMNAFISNELDPLYSDYNDILKMLKTTGVLPPLKEFDGILYDVYMSSVMESAVGDY